MSKMTRLRHWTRIAKTVIMKGIRYKQILKSNFICNYFKKLFHIMPTFTAKNTKKIAIGISKLILINCAIMWLRPYVYSENEDMLDSTKNVESIGTSKKPVIKNLFLFFLCFIIIWWTGLSEFFICISTCFSFDAKWHCAKMTTLLKK